MCPSRLVMKVVVLNVEQCPEYGVTNTRQPLMSYPQSCAVTGSSAMLMQPDMQKKISNSLHFARTFSGGFGLPIARVFARYFGGELKVFSVEGFGTDAFVYIPHLGHSKEVKPLNGPIRKVDWLICKLFFDYYLYAHINTNIYINYM